MPASLPPPPPPSIFPPPNTQSHSHPTPTPTSKNKPVQPALNIPTTPPDPNSILVSLLIHNGWPFADHWEYFVPSPIDPDAGIVVQAAGDVRGGFWLEVKRGLVVDLEGMGGAGGNCRTVPLGWVDGALFEPLEGVFSLLGGVASDGRERGGGDGVGRDGGDGHSPEGNDRVVVETVPRCEFERVLFKVPAPEKTLRTVGVGVDGDGGDVDRRRRITQRNCQTWVVESAEQLVKEGIFEQNVVDYLRTTSIMATD